jgi:general secretion pathway protein G
MDHERKQRGFTLVELLIVIGVIAILASIAFVALNPLGRYRDARNARRWTDVNAILAAIKLHQIDNNGNYVSDITDLTADLYYQIGTGEACNMECLNPTVALQVQCLNLASLVDSGHLATVPYDPGNQDAEASDTGYYLVMNNNGSITVGNCYEEPGSNGTTPEISVTR